MEKFTEEMIAPCGLDCSLCANANKEENPCPGCCGENESKPEFCSGLCPIIYKCEKRSLYRYCIDCDEFPCEYAKERDYKYTVKYAYPGKESPFKNMKMIKEQGIDYFLACEKERYTCKDCGGIICNQDAICSRCGKQYTF